MQRTRSWRGLPAYGVAWLRPACRPSGDRGVDLSWRTERLSLLIIVHGPQRVACVWRQQDDRGTRQESSLDEAIDRILMVLDPVKEWRQLLAPIHAETARLGYSEEEIERDIDEARREMREERSRRASLG